MCHAVFAHAVHTLPMHLTDTFTQAVENTTHIHTRYQCSVLCCIMAAGEENKQTSVKDILRDS